MSGRSPMRRAPERAFLLAAGRGERLRPLTLRTPKCLVEVDGRPMLEHWLERLERYGVREALVNTHHLAPRVEAYVRRRAAGSLRIRLAHEPELLGSAGTVAAQRAFVEGQPDFLVVYADNLTRIDLARLTAFHRARDTLLTMALFRSPDPSSCGIAELDGSGRILSFEEKPAHPRGAWANAGIYVATAALLDRLPHRSPADFGRDVLPSLAGEMYGYPYRGLYHDVGDPARLAAARRAWKRSARKTDAKA